MHVGPVLSSPALPTCKSWCIKQCLRPTFTVDLQNDPILTKICTNTAVLLNFLFRWRVTFFWFIPICSYKVMQIMFRYYPWYKYVHIKVSYSRYLLSSSFSIYFHLDISIAWNYETCSGHTWIVWNRFELIWWYVILIQRKK